MVWTWLLACVAGTDCTPGDSVSCACENGAGVEACDLTGSPGACTCESCNDGYALADGVCTNIDECAAGAPVCAAEATCTDTPGSFQCTCGAGYEGDGQACADIDECALGTDTCDDVTEACTNTEGAFSCDCAEGYLPDGEGTCTPDPFTFVADLSPRTVPVDISGVGLFTVGGLSRIGWQIDVVETPLAEGRTHKEPVGVTLPDTLTLDRVDGSPDHLDALREWAEGGDPTALELTLTGLSGEEVSVAFFDVTVDAVVDDAAPGPITRLRLALDPVNTFSITNYADPFLEGFPCPTPREVLEIHGVTGDSQLNSATCHAPGVMGVPDAGTSDPVIVPESREGRIMVDWVQRSIQEYESIGLITRSSGSIVLHDGDTWVHQRNFYEALPQRVDLFNPLKTYGETFLVDVWIVNDLAEIPR